jgi:hypothetical protein
MASDQITKTAALYQMVMPDHRFPCGLKSKDRPEAAADGKSFLRIPAGKSALQ